MRSEIYQSLVRPSILKEVTHPSVSLRKSLIIIFAEDCPIIILAECCATCPTIMLAQDFAKYNFQDSGGPQSSVHKEKNQICHSIKAWFTI